MNIDAEYLDGLAALGYDGCEAPFLYLVATHSGFFTLQQFTQFAAQGKGRPASRFAQKLIQKKHARATEFARRTHVYDIYSRRVYGRIGKDNLRNRRQLSKELIHTRLLILDFVLTHLDCEFLETEAEKVRYFHQTRAIPLTLLPGRIYTGLESNATTTRYFVDRHPIFIASQNFSSASLPLVSFAYCDLVERDLDAFITHLKNYEGLLRRLPAFEFIYACASSDKFKRAGRFFHRFFDLDDSANIENTVRYFEVRRLWDEKKYASVDRAGRDLLRWAKQHRRQPFLEAAYQKWISGNLGANEIAAVLRPDGGDSHIGFATCVLPHKHDLFERWAGGTGRTETPGQRSPLVQLPFRAASGSRLKESQ
jgi:hypothetical protein